MWISRLNCGFGSPSFSQASPRCRACSSVNSFGEWPKTMVLDCNEVAARNIASQRSLEATTARRMVFPRFFAGAVDGGKTRENHPPRGGCFQRSLGCDIARGHFVAVQHHRFGPLSEGIDGRAGAAPRRRLGKTGRSEAPIQPRNPHGEWGQGLQGPWAACAEPDRQRSEPAASPVAKVQRICCAAGTASPRRGPFCSGRSDERSRRWPGRSSHRSAKGAPGSQRKEKASVELGRFLTTRRSSRASYPQSFASRPANHCSFHNLKFLSDILFTKQNNLQALL